jgi:uncharacterized lipoprotein YajG
MEMTKKILLASVMGLFLFSGCLSTQPSKSVDNRIKATKKAESDASKVINKAKKVTKQVEEVTKESDDNSLPPESKLKDKAIEKAVEITDKKTDGTATKVIESVQ